MIMKNVFIAAALIAAAFVSCGPKYAEPTSTPGSKIAYSMSFIRNVAANVDKNENIVISPYSAGVALSMLAEGAEGQTKEEFNKALNDCIFKAENLGGNDTVIVNSVNSLWVDDDFSIRNRYLFLLQSRHRCRSYEPLLLDEHYRMPKWRSHRFRRSLRYP